tara:strand:+ start:249 stop:479 length:231 start_codon:yes stop_codon:yes gene_type:complete
MEDTIKEYQELDEVGYILLLDKVQDHQTEAIMLQQKLDDINTILRDARMAGTYGYKSKDEYLQDIANIMKEGEEEE